MIKHFTRFSRKQALGALLAVAVLATLPVLPTSTESPAIAANVEVTAGQFQRYIEDWSEREGFFDSDNFISNETSYQHVVEELLSRTSGGVYIGVGPDQNFTYLAHIRPSLAVIIDIRRQNMLQHLLFKALFERSGSRAEYLSLLFAKEKPEVDANADLDEVLRAVRAVPSSEARFQQNLEMVKTTLTQTYRLSLSAEDLRKVELVYRTFWRENLDLRFSSIGRGNAMNYPTYERLLLETDRSGHQRNYLASEEAFQWLKKFQGENRLIPIVGDFGGSHAFQSVAGFLKQNGLKVSALYASNVEFYLFNTPSWSRFIKNVRALPVSSDSIFIRAYFPTYGPMHPSNVRGHRSTSLVHAMVPFLDDYDAGKIPTYWEVVHRDK